MYFPPWEMDSQLCFCSHYLYVGNSVTFTTTKLTFLYSLTDAETYNFDVLQIF